MKKVFLKWNLYCIMHLRQFMLQMISQGIREPVVSFASVKWCSITEPWETGSTWVTGVGMQRGQKEPSKMAWCSAIAPWGSMNGFAYGLRTSVADGTEPCEWVSPTLIQIPVIYHCPKWPSPTSLAPPGTGLLSWMRRSARQEQSWNSGGRPKAACMLQTTSPMSTGYCAKKSTSEGLCGPWLTFMDRRAPLSSWVGFMFAACVKVAQGCPKGHAQESGDQGSERWEQISLSRLLPCIFGHPWCSCLNEPPYSWSPPPFVTGSVIHGGFFNRKSCKMSVVPPSPALDPGSLATDDSSRLNRPVTTGIEARPQKKKASDILVPQLLCFYGASCLSMTDAEEQMTCVACMDRQAQNPLPCGHCCLCLKCSFKIFNSFGTCPLCRQSMGTPVINWVGAS